MTDSAPLPAVRRLRFDPTRPRGVQDYERARRHSRRVLFLKFALPTIAAVSVIGFFLTMRFADMTGAALVGLAGLNIEKKSLVMDAPHMQGYDADRRPYQLNALKALQDLNNPKLITLDTIDALFGTDGPDKVTVKAHSGLFNGTRNTLVLTGGIVVDTSDGYHAILQDASIDITKGNLVSQKPVEIHSQDGAWLKANGVQIDNRGAKVTFVNGVSVNFIPPDDDSSPAPKPDASPAAGSAADKTAAAKPDPAAARDAAAARLKSATE